MTPAGSFSGAGAHPQHDRRRAARVHTGPLRVRLHRTCEGILVDISEAGALVRVPLSMRSVTQITVNVEAPDGALRLPGRFVRSSPHQVELSQATLARTEYKVAVEFSDLAGDQVQALRRLIDKVIESQINGRTV